MNDRHRPGKDSTEEKQITKNGVDIKSFEELMDYIEREALRRVDRYQRLKEEKSYDQLILKVLGDAEEPMSVELISYLTGIDKSRCCKILKSLEKWNLVKKVTSAKTSYYRLVSE